jgi:four helix bundle protein
MKVKKFEDLKVWQKAQDLVVAIYSECVNLKDFGFKDQITRATVSISNNIAEGFDRNSAADFCRFLSIALASCSEVRSMLYLSDRLHYITSERSKQLIEDTNEIAKMITGLKKYLKNYKKLITNNY